jgi:hypothetical protein
VKKATKKTPSKAKKAVKDLGVRANKAGMVRGGDTTLASGKVHVSELQISKVLDKSS